ncbi:uncharacterized protein SPSK_09136 [Sporothrix schenckii 1099-18]|uniref:Ysc84 actin-binding domain-containing protein n=1 Tax=Sporothrix schenckii 1099-18 TaxID=1397361 RepID=A0A0F2M754_SPOSC|nr:uncharacterized protein SPSK_09136 [Sporothrix schenckii 1099-18]KJR84655.1 hypothetical protein SPSK_09136 [Sporothrix schenckii 1099-18]
MTKVEITGEPADPESYYTQYAQQYQTEPQRQQKSTSVPYYDPQVNDNSHGGDNKSTSGSTLKMTNAAYYRSGLASRLAAIGARAASPINMLANRVGSEGFLPETMYKECEKAARILQGFSDQLTLTRMSSASSSASAHSKNGEKEQIVPRRSLIHIPPSVLQRAVGLAVFTTGRIGMHVSGATGSGVLIARRPDGSWSPPSGIQVHAVGAGFIFGADIYDCVLVLNTQEALDAFCGNTRLSLGSSLGVTAGPYGVGGGFNVATTPCPPKTGAAVDGGPSASGASSSNGAKNTVRQTMDRAAFSYIKSRGIYAGIKVDGTVVTSRQSANASFYGAPVTVRQILRGDVPAGQWQAAAQVLLDAVRVAEMHARPQQPQPYYPQQYPQQPGQAYPQQWYAPGPSASWAAPPAQPPTVPSPTAQPSKAAATPVVSPNTTATPATPVAPDARTKEQEAADEAAASAGVPPPTYSTVDEPSARNNVSPVVADEDVPPAYADQGQVHPGTSDSKGEH